MGSIYSLGSSASSLYETVSPDPGASSSASLYEAVSPDPGVVIIASLGKSYEIKPLVKRLLAIIY